MLSPLEVRKRCAELCELAYLGDPHFDKDGIQIFFVDDAEYLYVVTLGTNERRDWRYNLCFWAKYYAGNRYHGGYLKSIAPHVGEILNIIDEKYDSKPIVLTGHSAGGARSTILGAVSGLTPDQIVTFGAPRAIKYADESLQRFLNARLTNYKNTHDFVTKLPFGWRDYGKQVVRSVRKIGSEHPISVYVKEFF